MSRATLAQVRNPLLALPATATTDARFASYEAQYGNESWELDALKPEFLDKLVRRNIENHINSGTWEARKEEIEELREKLTETADEFERGNA